jgi:serine-type D-Ala-D-Ala carboxypeptidase (penicillin-binding protein 5/6)
MNLRIAGWVAAIFVVDVAVLLAGVQLARALPARSLALNRAIVADQPGGTGFSWPSVRESAVTLAGLDKSWQSGDQREVPIASVTKMMTAYIVLNDHPLTGGAQGPSIVVSSAAQKAYQAAVANGDSNAAVATGEIISERQALEALLLPSADNIADLLADWDAGSTAAFVAKMNKQARALGMTATKYTDPSGLAASTVSTARDQLILVRKVMAIPAFADIVSLPYAKIPVAGTVANYNYDTGQDGIIGIKTGTDDAAEGCWAFAVKRTVAGTKRVVYGVVLGAPPRSTSTLALVNAALNAGLSLVNDVPRKIRQLTALPAGTKVGTITVPWSDAPVPVVTASALRGLAVSGASISLRSKAHAPDTSFTSGQQVGEITASGFLGGSRHVALVTGGASGKAPLSWRLFRS